MLFESIQRVMCVTLCCLFRSFLFFFFYGCNFIFFKWKLFRLCFFSVVLKSEFYLWIQFKFFIFFNNSFHVQFSKIICLFLVKNMFELWDELSRRMSVLKYLHEILSVMIFDENMTNESFWSRHLFLCTNIVLLYLQHHAI